MSRRYALLSTCAMVGALAAFAPDARADDATQAEISALKAQLKRLEAKVDAQERRDRVAKSAPRPKGEPEQAAAAPGVLVPVSATGPLPTLIACPPGKICYKGLTFTPGGFVALEDVFRSRFIGADIGTPYGVIPLNNVRAGHAQEFRFSARQSRISGLLEGQVDPFTKLSAYGEFDFLGAAQTANSNESNSFNLRIRHLYGTIDRTDLGVHVLAGQNWSLATTNTVGIVPRKEDIPLTIDAQYVPGFIWARQPQLRVVKDITPDLAVGGSLENPATTESGTLPANFTYNQAAAGGGLFNSANSVSLNHVPDLVGKVAWDPTIGDRKVHMEAFGLGRDFYARENTSNQDVIGGGGGGSLIVPVLPKVFDFQVSGAVGSGIGRYGTSQLPDITVSPTGEVKPIPEMALLLGATWHATHELDVYTYAGEERELRTTLGTVGGINYGYGNPLNSNAGCNVEGSTTCTGNTRAVRQITVGAWDNIYTGSFGQLRAGAQYSYTQRDTFSAIVGGAPKTDDNIFLTSLRYYPFQ